MPFFRFRRLIGNKAADPDHGVSLNWLRETLNSDDVTVDSVAGRSDQQLQVTVVYIKSLVDPERLVEEVYQPTERTTPAGPLGTSGTAEKEDRRQRFKRAIHTDLQSTVVEKLLAGYVALFAPGRTDAYLVSVRADNGRSVSEATTEIQLMGPKEAFTEDLQTNLNRVRVRFPTDRLRVKQFQVGRLTKTAVAVAYIHGIADPDSTRQVLDSIAKIDVDFIRASNDIIEVLFQASMTPFPLAQRTEKPDRLAEALADGRIAVLVDGTPFAFLVPTTLNELQRNGEVFLGGSLATVYVRWLRYIGIVISLVAPALYAAVLSTDLHLLSPQLMQTVAATRQGVPYPVLLETLLLLLFLDIVTEATVQAPTPLGSTLTIAGSLIIGQAAVQAQLASQLMVIVLSTTAIGSLLAANIPLGYAVRIVKYPVTLAAGAFGLFGMTLALVALTIHVTALKSLNVPYMTPMGPLRWTQLRYYGFLSSTKGGRFLRPTAYDPEDIVREPPGGKDPT